MSRAVSSMSSRPGPIATTSASRAITSRSSGTSPDRGGRPTTFASGTAMLSAAAVVSSTASCSRPAPARSAAPPASSTAPGVYRDPPTTSTVPRDSLSPRGSGNGQPRSTPGVMTRSSGRLGIDFLLPGRRRALAVQMVDVVEQLRAQLAVDAVPAADGTVRDRGGAGDRHQFRFAELLGEIADEQVRGVVRDQQDAAARIVLAQLAQQRAEPEQHVGPRLAAGGSVVELAEPLPPAGLIGQPGEHAPAGKQVQPPQLAVAQPLVDDAGHAGAGQCQLGGLPGAQVRRDDGDVGSFLLRPVGEPPADRLGLFPAGVGQWDVRVPFRDVDRLEAADLRFLGYHIAGALPVPYDGEPLQLFHGNAFTRPRR